MRDKYGMHSAFDLGKHQETFINYLEAVILPDGSVEYATPSHVEKLIRITGEDREAIYAKMPEWDSPIEWLARYTGCVVLWSLGYIQRGMTQAQRQTLDVLIREGLVRDAEMIRLQ